MTTAVATEPRELVVTIPRLRLVSEANVREHWARRAERAKTQRTAAQTALIRATGGRVATLVRGGMRWDGWERLGNPEALVVTITRIAPRRLDSDNLARSAKAIRDGVADWLGVDDGDERIDWRYAQRRGDPGEYGVEIRLKWRSHE